MRKSVYLSGLLLLTLIIQSSISISFAQELNRYMMPPKELVEIIDAKSTPSLVLSPDNKYYILVQPQEMPDLSELAQPELKLAGLRINPKNYGTRRGRLFTSIEIHQLEVTKEIKVTSLPADGLISRYSWSPDSKRIAIGVYRPKTIELWVVNVETGSVIKWADNLNESLVNRSFEWLSDGKTIVFCAVSEKAIALPSDESLPEGPSVQETGGKVSKVRTYQDLLKNPTDELRFEHFATSQLYKVTDGAKPELIGNPGLISGFSVSPDANYLFIEQLVRPYSYIVPSNYFPTNYDIWSIDGKLVKRVAEIPLADDIPQGFSAVRKGPRSFNWRADAPATLYWAEAQDGGSPRQAAEIRDKLYFLQAPFNGSPVEFLSLGNRFARIVWGWDKLAVAYESWWETRKMVVSFFDPSQPTLPKKIIWDRSSQDAYGDPGSFKLTSNQWGENVLFTDKTKKKLYLSGNGATPNGDLPFVDEFDISTLKAKRIWRCEEPYYETFVDFLSLEKQLIITSRESVTEQPNYYIRDVKKNKLKQITFLPHPFPMLKDIHKEVVKYKRSDGITLTGTLYLPAGYVKGSSSLPVLMWAYPQEFVDQNLAGQVKGSPYRFIRPGRLSAIPWVARGYAVFDNLGMPIVGKDGKLPNDTFVEQLVDNAKAAIDTLVAMKVADPYRIAIGGHSYGAFMTANLMAHCDLFAAGLARSGAYNRTLTPFGFQSEERSYWEAPDVYNKLSPFSYADKINEPLLLIHGEVDNNSGTFPMQSERLFTAIKGHGGVSRLVVLPYEIHGYRARQSIMHTTWEMDAWLEKYVKNRVKK
ncbi:MAG: prolyl oligopeptidase family serine peptidase [Tenuifilaceae bacterium]